MTNDKPTCRYDATVTNVEHYPQKPEHRQDIVSVVANFDYATGAAWWLETRPGPEIGTRYQVTVVLAPQLAPLPGLGVPPAP